MCCLLFFGGAGGDDSFFLELGGMTMMMQSSRDDDVRLAEIRRASKVAASLLVEVRDGRLEEITN